MTIRGTAVHNNHNLAMYITELSPLNLFFIMVAYPGYILESTKEIEIKHGTYRVQSTRTIITAYILLELSLLFSIKYGSLCHVLVYKWCWITSSVIDIMHLGSIHRFQRFSWFI